MCISISLSSPIKTPLSQVDLTRIYESLSQSTLAGDPILPIFPLGSSGSSRLQTSESQQVQLNSALSKLPLEKQPKLSKGVGAFDYVDDKGVLHVATYVNDEFGTRILSDITPYRTLPNTEPRHEAIETVSSNTQSQNLETSTLKPNDDEWDEIEVVESATRNVQDVNQVKAKAVNNPSRSGRSNPLETLFKVGQAIPLPAPFAAVGEKVPFSLEPPTIDGWKGPPNALRVLYGDDKPEVRTQERFLSMSNFGSTVIENGPHIESATQLHKQNLEKPQENVNLPQTAQFAPSGNVPTALELTKTNPTPTSTPATANLGGKPAEESFMQSFRPHEVRIADKNTFQNYQQYVIGANFNMPFAPDLPSFPSSPINSRYFSGEIIFKKK